MDKERLPGPSDQQRDAGLGPNNYSEDLVLLRVSSYEGRTNFDLSLSMHDPPKMEALWQQGNQNIGSTYYCSLPQGYFCQYVIHGTGQGHRSLLYQPSLESQFYVLPERSEEFDVNSGSDVEPEHP